MNPRQCALDGCLERIGYYSKSPYCTDAHKQEAYRSRTDPDRHSPERKIARNLWLQGRHRSSLQKHVRRELAAREILPALFAGWPADMDQDPRLPSDRPRSAKKSRKSGAPPADLNGWLELARHYPALSEPDDPDARSVQRYLRERRRRMDSPYPLHPELDVALWHLSLDPETRRKYEELPLGELVPFIARLEKCRAPNRTYIGTRERLRLLQADEERREMTTAVAEILERLERIEESQVRMELRQLDEQERHESVLPDDAEDLA